MSKPLRQIFVVVLVLFGAVPAPAQNKITYQNFDWQVYPSPHFDIHYYTGMEPFIEEVVSYSESAYLKISKDLDHELRFRVPMVIYRTHGEFQQTNVTLSSLPDGVGAFAEPVQNRMVLPIDLPPDKLYQLIAHELTHIFEYSMLYDGYLGRALRSNAPGWLMEGLASYLAADEDNLDRMAIRDAVVNNVLPPIETLGNVTYLTYRYGHAIFDFIEQEHGADGLRTFLFEYRKVLLTNNLEKAIKESFGYDIETFNRRFNRYLRKKYFPVLLEKKSPDDHGTEIGVKRRNTITLSPALSPSGELIAAIAAPRFELDLLIISTEDGETVKNLTKGWSNEYRSLVTKAFAAKRDLSWSPVSDEVAAFARRENKWPLLIYNAVSGKRVADIVIDDIVESASPAYSADGRRIAFEGNRDGIVDIFEIDLETRDVRNITQDEFFDSNPWYSSDGKTLLYNRRIGSHWKIFSVDLDDPSKRTQLTYGPSSDVQPSLSRDGNTVWFSSDRDENGVFNIYALNLQSGTIEQYTDVVGGCFAPLELGERDGEKHLVFSAYFEGSFRLYRMPLKEVVQTISVTERLANPDEEQPFEAPIQLKIDPAQNRPYTLKWDIEAPSIAVGVADDGTFLSNASIGFSDLLGNHRFQITAASVASFSNYSASYFNLKRRYNWGVNAFDVRDYFLQATRDGRVSSDRIYRATGASVFLQYPISTNYSLDASVGIQDDSRDFLTTNQFGVVEPFATRSDTLGTIGLGITGDTARFQSFGPFQGKRFNFGVLYGPQISGDSDGELTEFRADFRTYRQLTRRSLLAWRAASIYNTGERESAYGFGGINQLRAVDYRELVGSRLAWSNLEFRFPLIDELRFPILRLGQIRGLLFFDLGAAWFKDDLYYDNLTGRVRVDPLNQPIPFEFWDSENNRMQDGRAAYGTGFQLIFIGGLQFNWIWARPLSYTDFDDSGQKFKQDGGGTRTEFYIAFDW